MKNLLKRIDKPLLIITIILCIIGLVMVFSASSVSSVLQYKVSSYYFFKKQAIVMLAAFIVGFLFLIRIPISKYQHIKSLLMLAIMGLLGGLFAYGTVTNSALSWYDLGLFSIQPSEFAKSIVIIYMACYFGKNINCDRRFFFLRPIIACGIVAGLIFIQPDLGTAAIIGLTVFFMFMSLPFNKKDKDVRLCKIIGTICILGVVGVMIFGGELLNKEQASRLTYKAPCTRYLEKTGYQVCNGMIAMNNGGLFGVGLGNSTQKYLYLPEAHTDFIFPIIVEEMGLITGIIIILIYMVIIYRILLIGQKSYNLLNSMICYGVACYIFLHVVINLTGILGLLPLTGVPLPFLSYGGSFALTLAISLALVQRVSIENYNFEKKRVLR